MKRILSIVLVLLLTTYNLSFSDDLNLSGEAAILIDGDTGQILFEKNADIELYPASTTKIMAGILAIELGNMDDIVVIDDEIVQLTHGSHIALEPGEKLRFEDLIYALLIQSANDAAYALAKHISGDIDVFVGLMNVKAQEMGALDTNFVNPNGLPHDDHTTTAYDLSLIAQYAMRNPKFREIVANHNHEIPISNKKDESRYLHSHNRLLFSNINIDVNGERKTIRYEGATGIKTGYTVAAQNCLVASATRGEQNLIAVILKANGKEVFSDAHKLFDCGFDNFRKLSIAKKGQFIDNIDIPNGMEASVAGAIEMNLVACVPKGSETSIEKIMSLNKDIQAPIEKGESLGKVEYYLGDQLLAQSNIISTLDVEQNMRSKVRNRMPGKWMGSSVLLLGFMLIRNFILKAKQKRRRKRRSMYRMDEHIR